MLVHRNVKLVKLERYLEQNLEDFKKLKFEKC